MNAEPIQKNLHETRNFLLNENQCYFYSFNEFEYNLIFWTYIACCIDFICTFYILLYLLYKHNVHQSGNSKIQEILIITNKFVYMYLHICL